MRPSGLNLVMMGTGPFAVPAFEALRDSGHSVSCVVTRPDQTGKSRKPTAPSPVRVWAQSHELPIFDPLNINEADAIDRVRQQQPDLLVVCDYGQILSAEALSTSRLGGINLHGSLLPAYRGAAPVQWAVLSGDAVTGVSVIHMTPRLDGGPVIATAETEIGAKETAGELEERLSQLGIEPTLQSVRLLSDWDGESEIGQLQDKAAVSKAPRLKKADGQIDWSANRQQIDCHIRAMQPWPGAFTIADTGAKQPIRIVIREVEISDQTARAGALPGEVMIDGGRLWVTCGDGCVAIPRLQPAGKKEMPTSDYLRGNPFSSGLVLQSR